MLLAKISVSTHTKRTLSSAVDLSKVLLYSKYSRLEFERLRTPVDDEKSLRHLLKLRGSDYHQLLDKHSSHYSAVDQIRRHLKNIGSQTRLLHRRDVSFKDIEWASAVITLGGDGTFLQAASKILNPSLPIIGINTDTSKSYGYLCASTSLDPSHIINRLQSGDFKVLIRQRIRATVDNVGLLACVNLHDEQMHFFDRLQNQRRHRQTNTDHKSPRVLPVRALNDVFVGEYVAATTSYLEAIFDNQDVLHKFKCSGMLVSTATGSTAWFASHLRPPKKLLRQLMKNALRNSNSKQSLTESSIDSVNKKWLDSMDLPPDQFRMLYSIKDPMQNRVFAPDIEFGSSTNIKIRSRLWDGAIVLDGSNAYGFDEGSWLNLEMLPEDSLFTISFS